MASAWLKPVIERSSHLIERWVVLKHSAQSLQERQAESTYCKAVLRAEFAELQPAMKARERQRGIERWKLLLPDKCDRRLKICPDGFISIIIADRMRG